METNMAILMADLSGYTALTETHGAEAAADLIDKYISIVETCLVGDCVLHQRTGDEIMIVSATPDNLADTAIMILSHTSNEENFLQVHGGLHYGKVLHRASNYFGSAINLTARITAKANAGRLLCSHDFVKALSDESRFPLTSIGCQAFKNVSSANEVFELGAGNTKPLHVDPVCRMLILDPALSIQHQQESGQYFCSEACLHEYNHRKTQQLN